MRYCKQEHYKRNTRLKNGDRLTESFKPAQYWVLNEKTRETIIPGTVTRAQANCIVGLLNFYEREINELRAHRDEKRKVAVLGQIAHLRTGGQIAFLGAYLDSIEQYVREH